MQKNHLVEKDEGKNRTELNIWISQTQRCVFFHDVPGYRKIGMFNSNEMWEMVQHLINAGYKVG